MLHVSLVVSVRSLTGERYERRICYYITNMWEQITSGHRQFCTAEGQARYEAACHTRVSCAHLETQPIKRCRPLSPHLIWTLVYIFWKCGRIGPGLHGSKADTGLFWFWFWFSRPCIFPLPYPYFLDAEMVQRLSFIVDRT